MLLIAILFPALAGTAVSLIPLSRRTRRECYIAVTIVTDLLCLFCLGSAGTLRLCELTEGVYLSLSVDAVGRWFLTLVLFLYTCVCFYAFPYMDAEEREEEFFAFFFVSFGAMISICMAANFVSLYLCFELVTLTSMPLVLHERTKESISAALKYLFYSIGGALLGLMTVITLCVYASDANVFAPGGFLDPEAAAGHETLLRWAVFLGILGFGAKAGLYPLHGWLPAAHPAAPAPASALLSGIIAKAGILAVIRLIWFAAGPDLIRGTWVQTAWTTLALLTIFMGSMTAFLEKVTKRRLAYSTISQLSYIMAGLSILSPAGLAGGLLHAAAHCVSKGVLFLCAGVFIYRLGKRDVRELRGIGQIMPVTMWCFLLGSLSLVGIPPMGGFASKWVIAGAALNAGNGAFAVLIPVVLLISALLTAGYLLPVAVDAFFPGLTEAEEVHGGKGGKKTKKVPPPKNQEPPLWMTIPMGLLCAAALCVGLFGGKLVEYLNGVLAPLF